jgi:hypothetical protein
MIKYYFYKGISQDRGEMCEEPLKRKNMFKKKCKIQGNCCNMIIDKGSTINLVST